MAQYGRPEYWDERYTRDPEPFDWYQRYSGLRENILECIKPEDNILQIGCGSSRLTEDLYEDGFKSITNIDISKVCVEQMIERHKDKESLSWSVMNACELDFPDSSFDAVIDKGTMDSILCGEGSTVNVSKMLSEVFRVLKPGGKYFLVTYGIPENRLSYLENDSLLWNVDVKSIKKPNIGVNIPIDIDGQNSVHYIFVATKKMEIPDKKPTDQV